MSFDRRLKGLELNLLPGRSNCILLDIALPKKNGFDVCRDLRQRDPDARPRGPVIDRVLGLKLGADDRRAEVRCDGAPVELSGLELKLLRYLIEHRGSVLGRDELLEKVWGYDATPVTRTVDVHIASLRRSSSRIRHGRSSS